jgi:SAM-dependent methyltransferase/uncharacterized protein YbaR (Trm112 family)
MPKYRGATGPGGRVAADSIGVVKSWLAEFLACPACGATPLSAGSTAVRCPAGHTYPIRDQIPRLVPGHERGTADPVLQPTIDSYSAWWEEVQRDYSLRLDNAAILRARTGLEPHDVAGKTVLDAGCGNGRFAQVLADWGAERVVAMDLGRGVDAARRLYGGRPEVAYVQASILDAPFVEGAFDVVISVGVLHHTPDTRLAFQRLTRLVRLGGRCAVYLYRRREYRHGGSEFFVGAKQVGTAIWHEPMRRTIVRLPHRAILGWSRLMARKRAALERARAIRPLNPLLAVLEVVLPYDLNKPHESFEFNVVRNYDHYSTPYLTRHSREEIIEWFQAEGYDDLWVGPYPTCVAGTRVGALTDPVTVEFHREGSIEEIEARGVEARPQQPSASRVCDGA